MLSVWHVLAHGRTFIDPLNEVESARLAQANETVLMSRCCLLRRSGMLTTLYKVKAVYRIDWFKSNIPKNLTSEEGK